MSYLYECTNCHEMESFWNGVGMMFPSVYEDLKKQCLEGRYGEEIKQLFAEYPQGAIDGSENVYYCPECQDWHQTPCLDFFVPAFESGDTINREKESDSPEVLDCVMPWELHSKEYKLIRKYKHTCPHCGNATVKKLVMEPMGRAGRKSSFDGIRFKCHECGNGYLEKTDCMVEID